MPPLKTETLLLSIDQLVQLQVEQHRWRSLSDNELFELLISTMTEVMLLDNQIRRALKRK